MFDTIIIGAGLSGLSCAQKLTKSMGVLVLDKSRGVGGRMATRRTLNTKFDHGAQFYRLKSDITSFHTQWILEKLTSLWFKSELGEHWNAKNGMTAFAKNLGSNLNIELEKEVHSISNENSVWRIKTLNNEVYECKKLIFTSPVPQTLAILERSQLLSNIQSQIYQSLLNLTYTKALILLLTLEQVIAINNGYEEYQDSDFFSISNQKSKGVSDIHAYTITMSDKISNQLFDQPDKYTHDQILEIFKNKFPQAKIIGSELKKWRYCQAKAIYKELYCEVLPNVFLIGDAFGGASLLGAIRSANSLATHLLN
jgi:predicted NAD/FAD-dependent oxidoreductase